ncbi:MAG TPA: M42 family metallopeptidase [Firmicutes bacterium]|jgi:putative aminopeptidase FrvX|nr:MAG: aminopeptidase [Peptococcaceae bacterium 1109]HHT72779.1 M42 family metallopeptidase [Bacillota bacterium]
MKDVIRTLTEAFGPSGYEGPVRELIAEMIKEYVDEISTDVMGNLIAVKRGFSPEGKKIMFSAHGDEIGIVVTHIDDKGFLRFTNVGGLYTETLVGNRVRFESGTIGVIYREKGELKDLTLDKLYIDIGAESKEDAEQKVRIGEFGIIHREFTDLGNRLIGKSMDDRIGCAILVEAIKALQESPNTLYFVFSSQEEVGLRGARTSAYTINPDLGIALDVTLTGDVPEGPRMEVSLGKGAAIKVKDSSMITHPKVKAFLTKLAEDNSIPHQFEVLERGGTDAGAIHLTREGILAGTISIPCRYVHTASEMVDIRDVQACVDLVKAVATADLSELI